MTEEDLGTVRWWGESWGAPVCDERIHIPTPVREKCAECGRLIHEGHRGASILYVATGEYQHWHLGCSLRALGVPVPPALLRLNVKTRMASARYPEDVLKRLEVLARDQHRSRSEILIEAAYIYVEQESPLQGEREEQ